MAQYRLNAYDADVYIQEFKGLMQYGDMVDSDLRYSPDCMNVETPGGVLQTAAQYRRIKLYTDFNNNVKLAPSDKVTAMNVYITNCDNDDYSSSMTIIQNPDGTKSSYGNVLGSGKSASAYILIVGKKAYEIIVTGHLDENYFLVDITNEYPVVGFQVNLIQEFDYEDTWSWCTYENDFGEGGDGEPSGKTNVLVMNSEKNGTFIYKKPGTISELSVLLPKLRHISRHGERLWGVGAEDEKDTIYYSRAFNAADWSQAGPDEDPADGGGVIRLATFDNDKINALIPFADSLIAFSDQRAWRITGTDPSSYYIQEQYGNGTKYPKTIAVMGNNIIMLGEHGLQVYDGSTVVPFYHECTRDIFEKDLNYWKGNPATAVVHREKYILAIANKAIWEESTTSPGTYEIHNRGYRTIVYDDTDKSITITDAPIIRDMCVTDYPLMFSVTADPITELNIDQFACDSFAAKCPLPYGIRWVSPWIALGRKDIQKCGFEVYFTPELNTDATDETVNLTFSIQTEKKTKSKTYTVKSLTATQRAAGSNYKQKRLHFGGTGRKFRLIIETKPGNTVPWRLTGGIHMIVETDKD